MYNRYNVEGGGLWLTGNTLVSDQRSYSTSGPVSTWMGDRLCAGISSWYVTSHWHQLSLAIPRISLASHVSWQQTETPIHHSRRPRGQLLRHALRRPCICCGGPKFMEPAAGALTNTRDSWPLQDGIKDLSSLHPATVPNCLTRSTLVMTIHYVMAR